MNLPALVMVLMILAPMLSGSRIVLSVAGVRGGPILFKHPVTVERHEGWNPAEVDDHGNRVGKPTAQTHAATLFNYDDDGDQDLYWLGSTLSGGEGARGEVFPGPGRLLRGDGRGHHSEGKSPRHRKRRLLAP